MHISNINQNYTKLEQLLSSGQKVFSLDDLVLIWSESDRTKVSDLARWYINQNKLFRIKSGLFSLFDPSLGISRDEQLTIAQKLITPSYISYHTALSQSGINFQYYSSIHSCSLINKEIVIGNHTIVFHKIEPEIFFNPLGITKNELGLDWANPERAVCDSWYINSGIGLDNIANLDLDLLLQTAQVYNKPRIWRNLKLIFGIKKPKKP